MTALTDAITANTEATNAAVAKINTSEPTADQLAALAANTKALNDAVNPPAPPTA